MPEGAEAEVRERLNEVVDPELGIGIVDLGLVYRVAVAGGAVTVEMTLTARGCPLGDAITKGVRRKLLEVPGVTAVDVRLVWEPAWTPDLINPILLGGS